MTIKDIAKECGVAVGTVSRVLNNHPDVSDQTREKVLAIVKKHGFVINANAQQLKAQNRKTLVIILKGTSSIFLNSLLEKCLQRIETSPYTARIVVLDENENEAKSAKRIFYEQKPVGFIFLGGNPELYEEDFKTIQVPCVLISNQANNVENGTLSSVSIDSFDASKKLSEFLIKNGHSKIGVIGGDIEKAELSRFRYQGFCAALTESNISFDYKKAYVTSLYSFEGGAKAAKELLAKYPDLTAIFTMSDVMAIGAIRQLKDMGYSVPGDISIVGFDGTSLADFYEPRLTTIKQIQDNLVNQGLDTLLNSIERNSPSVHIVTPFQLIEGASVKKMAT